MCIALEDFDIDSDTDDQIRSPQAGKSMIRKRCCPWCQTVLPVGTGVRFDKDNNVICINCDKPIVCTNQVEEAKAKIEINKRKPSTVTYYGGKNDFGRGLTQASQYHNNVSGPYGPHGSMVNDPYHCHE